MDNEEYIKNIIGFVNDKYDKTFSNRFKIINVYNYCVVNNNVNNEKLFKIINSVLSFLIVDGYLMKFKHTYMTIKKVDLSIFNNKYKIKRQEMRKYVTNIKK